MTRQTLIVPESGWSVAHALLAFAHRTLSLFLSETVQKVTRERGVGSCFCYGWFYLFLRRLCVWRLFVLLLWQGGDVLRPGCKNAHSTRFIAWRLVQFVTQGDKATSSCLSLQTDPDEQRSTAGTHFAVACTLAPTCVVHWCWNRRSPSLPWRAAHTRGQCRFFALFKLVNTISAAICSFHRSLAHSYWAARSAHRFPSRHFFFFPRAIFALVRLSTSLSHCVLFTASVARPKLLLLSTAGNSAFRAVRCF